MRHAGVGGRAGRLAAIAGLSLAAALAVQAGVAAPVRSAEVAAPPFRSHPLIPAGSPSGGTASTLRGLGWSSYNWSGYDLTGGEGAYTAITGCWTVPTVSAGGGANADSLAWIGIDGVNDEDLIQTGTEQDWFDGSAQYGAWWEILPNYLTPIAMTIDPDDAMCAAITQGTGGNWTITLTDETTRATFSTVQAYAGPGESSEWVMERPLVCDNPPSCTLTGLSNLADYGQTTFYPVSANGANPELVAGDGGSMLDCDPAPYGDIPCLPSTPVVSTPSAPNGDSDGFSVAYGSAAPSAPTTETTPSVFSVSPATGPASGGQKVAIAGSGFEPGATVSFGANPAPRIFFDGSDELTVLTPAGSDGGVAVTVSNPSGLSGNKAAAFAYLSSSGPLPTVYTALQPYRVCDTRSVSVTGYGTECSGYPIGQGQTLDVQITGVTGYSGQSVPSNAQSVVLNVTAISGSATTYLTVFPAGSSPPNASNLNVTAGLNQANLVVMAVGAGGQVGIYNSAGTINVAVDVEGYFAPASGSSVPGLFHPLAPLRICDTRPVSVTGYSTECSGNPLGQGQWERVVLSGPGAAPTSDAASVALNLTAVTGTATTFLSVVPPSGSDQCPTSAPGFSNLNIAAGTNLPNRVIVPLGPAQDVCVYNSAGAINFILDVNGWFGNGSEGAFGATFYATSPLRICDTRPTAVTGYGTECSGDGLGQGSTLTIPVASVDGVPAAGGIFPPVAMIANVTAVSGNANTYFTLYPSDVARPNASDLNVNPGQTTPNLVVVQLATTGGLPGDVGLFNAAGNINAILDVAGWFQ